MIQERYGVSCRRAWVFGHLTEHPLLQIKETGCERTEEEYP